MAKWVKWRLQFLIWLKFFNSNAKFDWLPNHYCPKQNRPIASVTQSTMRSKIRRFLNLEVFQYLGYYLTKFTEQNFKRLWDCATDFNLGRSKSVEMNGHHCSIIHTLSHCTCCFSSLFFAGKKFKLWCCDHFSIERSKSMKRKHTFYIWLASHMSLVDLPFDRIKHASLLHQPILTQTFVSKTNSTKIFVSIKAKRNTQTHTREYFGMREFVVAWACVL